MLALSGTSTVSIATSGTIPTLNISLASGFVPTGGNTFTIINNAGTGTLTGTFSGLANGAIFQVGGAAFFQISYSGNDVVLTCLADTWTGTVSTDWNTPGNWSLTYVPTATTDVVVPSTTNRAVLDASVNPIHNLTISSGGIVDDSVNNATFTVDGNWTNTSGTFTTGTGTVSFNGSAAQTIGGSSTVTFYNLTVNNTAGVTLSTATVANSTLNLTAGSLDMHANALSVANLAGTATVTDSTTAATLTVNNSSPDSFGGTLTGALALTKTGSGNLTLTGGNSFTGNTILSTGTLTLGNAAALGAAAQIVTLNSGTLDLATGTTVNAYNTIMGGTATIVSDLAGSGPGVAYTLGTLNIGAFTLNVAGGSNVASGTAGVSFGTTTFTGAPTLNITNPSLAGTTTLLTLGAVTNSSYTPTFTGSGNFAQSGVWGAGSGGLTLASTYTGTATLNQANTFTGTVTLNGGTLRATTNAAALGAGSLTLAGGTLQLANASGTNLNFARNTTVSAKSTITST